MQAVVATTMTQPVDVMKTRLQNAKLGDFSVSPEPCSIYIYVQYSRSRLTITTKSVLQYCYYRLCMLAISIVVQN